ncbi:NAD(P)-dependent oxidoreductase [Cellulomonas sp. Sa3CUA2]|uniref:NAD(P)-dependent oxidoreductase n=1 Tax=Cellulomonas avistercoris TaxID=2762242 RepID=A0ABR8QGP8_9CELL|nr:NAD-dependent epimerase/dehydratase family protein [Cellulomonas avistercoris]MBD7919602.1 NAD(P)-dependent oxidoreductase [Cellulomonas avistercoris]
MRTVDELVHELTRPTDRLVQDIAGIEGDIVVLGVGGKVGPTVATLAANAIKAAGVDKKVYGVARFSDRSLADELERAGVVPVVADVTDDDALAALPDAANVVYMVGHKFGTTGSEHYTWMMNSYLPGRVAQRYSQSRIVAFSTLLVYPMAPVAEGGSREDDPVGPWGEYAASCVGRERVFEHFALKNGTPLTLFRLGYAIETRYGVLAEIASAVNNGDPIDLSMGHASVIWQGDAAEYALRSLLLADNPPTRLNVTGPEIVPVRWLAHRFAERLGTEPKFVGVEEPTAYVLDGTKAHQAFGYPRVPLLDMIDWVAQWTAAGGGSLGKPTKFQERGGRF